MEARPFPALPDCPARSVVMDHKDKSELSQQAAEYTLSFNPVIGPRGRDLLSSARMVLRQTLRQPIHSAKHALSFGREVKNVLLGRSELQSEAGDRRFDDPTWRHNPLFRRYLQTYLAWRQELNDWMASSNLSEQDASRGQFVISLLTEAMAPTNTLANPTALKRFYDTGGKSVL